MGLDMYLTAEKYVGDWSHRPDPAYDEILKLAGLPRDDESPSLTVKAKIGYWRKANAIHAWFVENVQGGVDECQSSSVSREQLEELRTTCLRVLSASKTEPGRVYVGTRYVPGADGPEEMYEEGTVVADPSVAQELLPTRDGFFFGATHYDQWYVKDLQHTVEVIDRALKLEHVDFEYQASW